MAPELIIPVWPAPASVGAGQTTRRGGVSTAPYAACNLGDHVGDLPERVTSNRAALAACLPAMPLWLEQVHGVTVLDLDREIVARQADASVTRTPGHVCAVMTADCLPVLFCDRRGGVVAAAHAGWRGLLAGVLEATVAAMAVPGTEILAWLGPAIGPAAFEVGDEVRAAFVAHDALASAAFVPHGERWLADLYLLARQRLAAFGVVAVFGGDRCTLSEPDTFFSYRRDGVTGRMASCVWLLP